MVTASKKRTTEILRDSMPYQLKQKRAFTRIGDKAVVDYMPYIPRVKLCIERARLLTKTYKLTEGEPIVLRRAYALANILDNMTI